jgi:hypothetical protein
MTQQRPPERDDLPLVRDVPRRADPGSAGRRRIAQISQTVGVGWAAFWWFLAPSAGAARWVVGAAGGLLIVGARFWLGTQGARALDVSHLDLQLTSTVARRGQPVEVTLAVTEPARVRGRIDVTVACVESYAYKVHSDRSGPSRRTGHNALWQRPFALQPLPSQSIRIDIPEEAPFSYDGDYVAYTWTVTATERVARGLDPVIELPLRVLP